MNKGLLIVVSGASGTGKGTVCKKLLNDLPKLNYSISATTRAPRAGEVDGREYIFLTLDTFKQWISENKFLEYAEVYGNFYGTPLHKINEQRDNGQDVLLEIDTQGALNLMNKCSDGIFIFLLPPSLEELKNRIQGRGTETSEALERRLKAAKDEIEVGKKYQYVIVNNSVDETVENIKTVIAAERYKVFRNLKLFEKF